MLTNSEAYLRLKEESQHIFDFAVAVCYAVPALKKTLKAVEQDESQIFPKPDFFKNDVSNVDHLRVRAKNYKLNLAKYLFISSFSFFEAYIVDLIDETLRFHGGYEFLRERAFSKLQRSLNALSRDGAESKRKLQEPPKNAKKEKYVKYGRRLKEEGYKFPSELFSAYGIEIIGRSLKKNNITPGVIPEVLKWGLLFQFSEEEMEEFERLRRKRNNVAHGRGGNFDLRFSIEANAFLRNLATRIDQHVVQHYMLVEPSEL